MNKKQVLKYLVVGKDGSFLTALYKGSISSNSELDSAMKFDTEEEARILAKYASKVSNNFKEPRILVFEHTTYFLDEEKIPNVDELGEY